MKQNYGSKRLVRSHRGVKPARIGGDVKSYRFAVIISIFLFTFIFSFFLAPDKIQTNSNSNNSSSKSTKNEDLPQKLLETSTSTVIIDNKTITQGQDLYESQSYDFNGSVYDTATPLREYDNAYLETQIQGVDFENDSLTCNNTETKIRTDAGTTMTNGTNVGSGNFWSTAYASQHDGTYSFTRDTNGGNPTGWTILEDGGTVNIIASLGTHKKVLELYDNNAANYVTAYNTFAAQTTGTIEFWYAISATNKIGWITLYDGAAVQSETITFAADAKVYAFNGAVDTVILASYTANQWYRIRIDFNTGTDKNDIYIDGIKVANQFSSIANSAGLTKFMFSTGWTQTTFYCYTDAIGYSWTTSKELRGGTYIVGDNRNPLTADLYFTVVMNFAQYTNSVKQKLGMYLNAYYKTNISNYIDFWLWNYAKSIWIMISNTSSTSYQVISYYNSTTTANKLWSYFFDASGNVLIKWHGRTNAAADFQLNLPWFNVTLVYKLDLSIQKSFSLKGNNWRYRFHLKASDHYTDWVYFEVVEAPNNIEMISESPYYTRWDFIKTSGLTTTDLYINDFTDLSSEWYLFGVSEEYMILSSVPSDDSYVDEFAPNYNGGSNPTLYVGIRGGGEDYDGYVKYNYGLYLEKNFTASQVKLWWLLEGAVYDVYKTQDFSESTITYNNRPANIGSALITETVTAGEVGSKYYWFNLVSPSFCYGFIESGSSTSYTVYSSESAHPPEIRHSISKIYQGTDELYCQTNITETLSLRSPALGLSLQSGDQIVVNFNTTSSNRIDLNLLNIGGATIDSHILSSQGNTNYNDQTATFSVSSTLSVDQLEFSGLFTDTKNLQVDSIQVFRYNAEMNTSYVNPQGLKAIRLDSGYDYNYSVYENGILVKSGSITTTNSLQTLIYTSPQFTTIYLNLYDSNNNHLDFNAYIIYVDYTAAGVAYDTVRMSSNAISVDKDSYISFSVYDSFNNLVTTSWTYATTQFIDITLNTYELKIKNERQNPVSYNLTSGVISKFGNLFSNEILTTYTSAGSYTFTYTELGVSTSFSFSLTSNQIFVLNASKLCFISYQNQRGDHLSFDNFKTYINGTLLYENIFYGDIGASKLIATNDSFDISIKNTTYSVVSGDNYIPIILTQYSLKVMSQQLVFNHINITRDPNYYSSPYSWSEWIAPNEIIKFSLFAGYYKINLTNNEAGSSSYYAYTLAGDDILLITSSNTIYNVLMNLANVNTTIGNQITNVQIDLSNQNTQINNSIINVDINLGNINSTLGNLLISQGISLTNINSNISTLYTFINNSFTTVNSNMNNSFIYIESNIVAVNNSISNLISGLSSTVFLVNNSIYTAITQVGANLFLVNNTIAGNLSVILQQNDFLTELYKTTMFSSLLNWSNVGTNSSLISSQIDAWTFVNQYKDDAVKVMLRYNSQIDSLEVAAQDQVTQGLPKTGSEYRLYSIANDEYLSDWEPLDPAQKEVNFGFYEETVGLDPEKSYGQFSDYVLMGIVLLIVIASLGVAITILYKRNKKNKRKAESLLDVSKEMKEAKRYGTYK